MIYRVEMTVNSTACIDIEADSEEEAIEKAAINPDLIWEGGEIKYVVRHGGFAHCRIKQL